jgi:hypothetical protein
MSTSFNLSSGIEVFPCPNCRETINTSMAACKFCGTPIDRAAAAQAAADTTRVSAACSDASYLKIMAGLLIPFFVLMFIPFLNLAGVIGLWFLRLAIPFMCIRWWIKYAKIKSTDPDFSNARGTAIWVSVVGVAALIWISFNIFTH